MPDPRLMSLHLEGQPRREQFRAARDAIHAACGTHTLAGDMTVKKLLLSVTVAGQPTDYVMTLRKYNLKNAQGGTVMSRWVVQGLTEGSN